MPELDVAAMRDLDARDRRCHPRKFSRRTAVGAHPELVGVLRAHEADDGAGGLDVESFVRTADLRRSASDASSGAESPEPEAPAPAPGEVAAFLEENFAGGGAPPPSPDASPAFVERRRSGSFSLISPNGRSIM